MATVLPRVLTGTQPSISTTPEPPPIVISPYSGQSIGGGGAQRLGVPGAAGWGVNFLTIFVPFRLSATFLCQNIAVFNGATVAGTQDLGLYSAAGTRLASTGNQARSAGLQSTALAVTLAAGQYYFAVVLSASTDTIHTATSLSLAKLITTGCAQQTLGSAVLPATATMVTMASNFIPWVAISSRSFF